MSARRALRAAPGFSVQPAGANKRRVEMTTEGNVNLCVPKMSSMVLTSRVASRPFGRDDHRPCACGSSSS
jgi:hypothetical protein